MVTLIWVREVSCIVSGKLNCSFLTKICVFSTALLRLTACNDKINKKIIFLGKGFWNANDFGGRVRRLIDFGLSGSTPVDKSNVLEVKIELWLDACR